MIKMRGIVVWLSIMGLYRDMRPTTPEVPSSCSRRGPLLRREHAGAVRGRRRSALTALRCIRAQDSRQRDESRVSREPALALGLNVVRGEVTYPGVAEAFGLPCRNVAEML